MVGWERNVYLVRSIELLHFLGSIVGRVQLHWHPKLLGIDLWERVGLGYRFERSPGVCSLQRSNLRFEFRDASEEVLAFFLYCFRVGSDVFGHVVDNSTELNDGFEVDFHGVGPL